MKIIDGKNATLGRLASYVAKETLRGEDIVVLNCEQVIITGDKGHIKKIYQEKREKIGSGQKGPKYPRRADLMVKRTIRGMLPNHRKGRGKIAFRKIRCYVGIPKEFEASKKILAGKIKKSKFVYIKQLTKNE